jgi:predicted lipid-binding transport protein (Tim44 family)
MSVKDVLSLETMMTPKFIQFFYKIGLVGVLLIGLSQLFSGSFIGGIMTVLLGFLAIRVISEMVIVYFKSNNVEVSMEDLNYEEIQEQLSKMTATATSKFDEFKDVAGEKFDTVKGAATEKYNVAKGAAEEKFKTVKGSAKENAASA